MCLHPSSLPSTCSITHTRTCLAVRHLAAQTLGVLRTAKLNGAQPGSTLYRNTALSLFALESECSDKVCCRPCLEERSLGSRCTAMLRSCNCGVLHSKPPQ